MKRTNQNAMKPSDSPNYAELTKEKTLIALYRAIRAVPRGRHYRYWWIETGVAMPLAASIFLPHIDVRSVMRMCREVWATGLSFAASVFGILLAGFTIFATMTTSEFAPALVKSPHEESGLPYLKYMSLLFVRVFVEYLEFMAIALLIQLFASPGGPAGALAGCVVPYVGPWFWPTLAAASAFLTAMAVFHLVVELQSFVFNIYITVMGMARIKVLGSEPEPNTRSPVPAERPRGIAPMADEHSLARGEPNVATPTSRAQVT